MAEYIEREALLKKFTDAENKDNKAVGIGEFLFAVIRGIIENQPAADVVEVVRCKDGKYYRPQVKSAQWNSKTNYCCRTAVIKVEPNDFCSFGAKMDGKGEGE